MAKVLNSARAMLLLIDVQEAFVGHVKKMKKVVKSSSILAEAAAELELPTVVTEQYPKGLGHTVAAVADKLQNHKVFEKTSFSCMSQAEIADAVLSTGRGQIILAGVEGHVCVLQTALDLLAAGKEVFIVQDAVSSRSLNDCRVALDRLAMEGAVITTVETVVMELIKGSRHKSFKMIQGLIK